MRSMCPGATVPAPGTRRRRLSRPSGDDAPMMHSRPINLSGVKRTILVVEDNELNREMLCAFLSDDFDIIQAENGLVGLEQLEQNYEDLSLVLLDVYMPECDGFEFLRRKGADERFAAVPVIVATASDAAEDEITVYISRLADSDTVIDSITQNTQLKNYELIQADYSFDEFYNWYDYFVETESYCNVYRFYK